MRVDSANAGARSWRTGEPRRVLVTGGCGFVGAHVVADLCRAGHAVTVLDNEAAGERAALAGLPAAFRAGDVRDAAALEAVVPGQDAVVHLAAAPDLAGALRDPVHGMDVNVRGSLCVLEAARRHGVAQVLAASSGGTVLGDRARPVHAEGVPAPRSPLGASKLAMEGYLSAYARSFGLAACSLRLANVYGPGCTHKTSVVAEFMRDIAGGRRPVLHGDGRQARDFVYVRDVAAGIRRALEAGATGTYQLGSGAPTTIRALLEAIAEVAGRPVPWPEYAPARVGEVRTTYCDIAAARADFGFDPATPLPAGLARTWAWLVGDAPAHERMMGAALR